MITVGGATNMTSSQGQCDPDLKGINVFDMTSAQWSRVYYPKKGSTDYQVPTAVAQQIVGTEDGGATKNVPTYGFTQDGLAKMFGAPASSVNQTNPFGTSTPGASSVAGSSHLLSPARIAPIAAGTIGDLVLLALLAAMT